MLSRRTHISLHFFAALSAALLACLLLLLSRGSDLGSVLATGLFLLAAIAAVGGYLPSSHAFTRLSSRLAVALLALFVAVASAEGIGRILRIDFQNQSAAIHKLPPFFRTPTVPVPPAFFRHAGPECWTGAVLRTGLELSGAMPGPYQSEAPITVCYDEQGFRNEAATRDWELAIAGDSFVELGFLPFQSLFTTRISKLTGLRVRNLGVSHTGPLTQLTYLQLFGVSPGTRAVVIVFYEGNDLADLALEDQALRRLRDTGHRDFRIPPKQTSFLTAIGRLSQNSRFPLAPPRKNAHLLSTMGEAPMTLVTRLAPDVGVAPPMQELLGRFLTEYSTFAHARKVKPYLVYMPCKTRVMEGLFAWNSAAEEAQVGVIAANLPDLVRLLCERAEIGFLNLTDPLKVRTIDERRPLFNLLIDSHLNAEGSKAVGEIIAQALDQRGNTVSASRNARPK